MGRGGAADKTPFLTQITSCSEQLIGNELVGIRAAPRVFATQAFLQTPFALGSVTARHPFEMGSPPCQ